MDLDLKDKVAVMTGASKGIGLAIVNAFGRENARVVAGSQATTPELTALCGAYDITVVTVDLGMGISTGRITEADEVATLAVFPVSPRAANITGVEFVIDGGQVKTT